MTALRELPGRQPSQPPTTSRDRLRRGCDVATDLAIGVLTVTLLLFFGSDLGYLPSIGLLVWVAGIATGAAIITAGVLALAARAGAPRAALPAPGAAASGT